MSLISALLNACSSRRTLVLLFILCSSNALADLHDYKPTAGESLQDPSGFAAVIRSEKSATLSTQIDGVITDVLFKEGETFREGDKLFELDCTLPYAEKEKAAAHLKYLEQEHRSNSKLSDLDSISDMTLAKSAAEVKKAIVELATMEYKVDQCAVYAPFSGSVVLLHANQYENVQAKSQIIEIINNDDLKIEFLMPSELLSSVKRDQEFELFVQESAQSYRARVINIIPRIDSVSQTIKVIGEITSPSELLWSGMSGSVHFPIFTNQ